MEEVLENAEQTDLEETNDQPPKMKRKLYAEHILAIIAGCTALLTLVMVLLCLPYFNPTEDPEKELHRHPGITAPRPSESPTEGPTAPTYPPPEANPYGKLDFQYDGRYLSCLKADTVPGIDVSAYQGNVDWKKVKESGIEFVIVRLGYRGYGTGKLVEDSNAHKNIQGALAAGLDVGVYFFSQAITVEEAAEEAQFVLERIGYYDITMPVVFDWEYVNDEARTANMDRRTLTDCYLEFSRIVEEAGYTPMAYFNTYQSRSLMILSELED